MNTVTANKGPWRLAVVMFLGLTAWWGYIQVAFPKDHIAYQIFSGTYGLMALYGGIFGLVTARAWGGFKSVVGKAVGLFALGLLFQEFGQLAYSYYAYFLHTEIPYPSLGDIGYFGSIPLYIAGGWQLAKAAGVKFSLRGFGSRILALFIPLVILLASYAEFLRDYQFAGAQWLTVSLDFGYPLGQAIYISVAILAYLLSRKLLGGIMRKTILLVIFALAVQYAADFTFLYLAHKQAVYPGSISDFIYLVSYFLMTISLLRFGHTYGKVGA
ncbi:MAG TPA: hypothetical protein VLF21_01500 [Candidatus Saccharimonadales bacterium]|nr:hypothetical protein [Candidatus Saccharimonadales bacterium]